MWIRKQCLTLSKNWTTPVSFWLDLPLRELAHWIEASNEKVREDEKGG